MFVNRASRLSTILLLTSFIVLPQSYLIPKTALLGVFLLVHLALLTSNPELFVSARDLLFYGLLCAVAIIWSIVGVTRGAPPEAILANLRLYAGWSVAYLLILSLMRNAGRLDVLHTVVVLSVFAIAGLNLFAL